jgi:hypothetical protein
LSVLSSMAALYIVFHLFPGTKLNKHNTLDTQRTNDT